MNRRNQGWHKPYLTSFLWQKTYGVKVGHVMRTGKMYLALFDGRKLGAFHSEDGAKAAVDLIGCEWVAPRGGKC